MLKPFKNSSTFISQEVANPGFSVLAPSEISNGSTISQFIFNNSVVPFSGKGVVLGSVVNQDMHRYQGSANAPSTQQNVREVPSGPNPLTEDSKPLENHDVKTEKSQKYNEDLETPDVGNQDSMSEDENIDLLNEL